MVCFEDLHEQLAYPDSGKDLIGAMEVRYSMPRWILAQWETAYGRERTEEILQGFAQDAGIMVRVNQNQITPEELVTKLTEEGVSARRNPHLSYALELYDVDYLMALPSFVQGDFYVQDLSSMMVAHWADPKPGDYVLDVCAAPGGKSTHMAELMKGTGTVEARDLTEYKVGLIQENVARHHLSNMTARVWDATMPDPDAVEKADVLVCDLPCSGLGVMGKKTDMPEKQQELVVLQRQILDVVCSYVKRGGIIIYSTCTIHREENEENVKYFLAHHPDYKLLTRQQMFPGEWGRDGFYIAKLQRMP